MYKIIAILFLFTAVSVYGQSTIEFKKSLTGIESLDLEFELTDSISIQKWNNNEILVRATVNINDNKNNENFIFNHSVHSGTLKLESEIKDLKKISKSTEIVDEKTGETIRINCHFEFDAFIEVFIPQGINVELHTISGDVLSAGFTGNQYLKTISGDIDYHLLPTAKVNLKLSTLTGEMYSDFDFEKKDNDYNSYVSREFSYSLNNGKSPLKLETISGNIYLRKTK